MSEIINTAANVNATPETPATVENASAPAPAQDHTEHVQAQESAAAVQENTDDPGAVKEAQKLLRKAVDAFARANRDFVLGRVQSGKFCCEYVHHRRFAMKHGRALIVKALAGRLAEIADGEEDADPNRLMKVYQCVFLLSGKPDCLNFSKDAAKDGADWRNLSWGKLLILSTLVVLDEQTETYSIRPGMTAKDGKKDAEAAKALFAWACGTADERPSRKDIADAVLLLVNPEKAAEKAKAAEKKAAESTDRPAAPAGTAETPATVEDATDEETDEETDENEEQTEAPETVQENLLKAAAQAGTAKDVASMAAELIHGAEDGTAVVKELSRVLDWSPDMAVALANGIMETAPKSARALYLALRNLMTKAGERKDGAAESNGATVSA